MISKPSVLQVIPALHGSGGPERGTIEIAIALKKAGYGSFVASSGGHRIAELERHGVEHFKFPLQSKNPFVIWRNIKRLEKAVMDNDINIVHARSRAPAYSAAAAAKRTGAIFLTTFHGMYGLGPMGIKKIYNEIMVQGALVIAPSYFIEGHVMRHYKIPKEQIRVIPRGADLMQFDPQKVHFERITQLFKKWELRENQTVIMLPGRLSRMKGSELLLDALKMIKTDKDLRCLLVGGANGKDDFVTELNRKIKKNMQQKIVQITGHCDDMPAAFMTSDIVVIPSIYPEAFGKLIVEAQAMGRIVIASGHGGAKEIIDPGVNGFLFPPEDVPTLAFFLERAINMTTPEREKMMKAAQNNVRTKYSTEEMCRKTLKVYEEVLKNGQGK